MNTQKEKSIDDLVLIDDWLFGNFFSQPEYFKIMIEILLDRKVKEVKPNEIDNNENANTQKSNNKTNLFSNQPDNNSNATLEAQKTAISNWGFKFVRFDIIFEDSDEIINVEMQNAKQSQDLLPKRAAYYTTKINEKALRKGEDYTQKRNTYVIFLCDFDPFNNGDYRYTARYVCQGKPSKRLLSIIPVIIICSLI